MDHKFAAQAQLDERSPTKRRVAGSSPVCGTNLCQGSSVVERRLEIPEVEGSTPSLGTNILHVSFSQQQNFLSRLLRVPSGCLEFQGSRTDRGYGKFRVGSERTKTRRLVKAPRVAFFLEHGWLPDVVRHSCDNPPCCDPKHLIAGDQLANMADMDARGRRVSRGAAGEKNRHAILTEKDVRHIRRELLGRLNNKQIAAIYGVTHSNISAIRRGKSWSEVK